MEAGVAVLIPAVTTFQNLARTLEALDRERHSGPLDVVVVSRQGGGFDASVRAGFPWVRVIAVPAGTPVPVMRHQALGHVAAPMIAIIEDHVTVPPGWVRGMAQRVGETGGVVAGPLGGPVESSLVQEAAFLCEYSQCLTPRHGGPASWLPGNNTTYPAAVLRRHAGILADGGWEDRLHRAIAAEGGVLWMDPDLVAVHDLPVTVGGYAADRYWFSRAYAGARVRGAPLASRLAYAAGTLLLPGLLLGRIMGRAVHKPRYRGIALKALPLLMLFVVAWAAGECIGYLRGPGMAPGKVR